GEGMYRWSGFMRSCVNPVMPVPNQFVGVFEHGPMKVRGVEIRRSDAPLIIKRAQAEVLRCLSRAHTLASLCEQVTPALEIVRSYRRYLLEGRLTAEELAVTKSLSKD